MLRARGLKDLRSKGLAFIGFRAKGLKDLQLKGLVLPSWDFSGG